VDKTLKVKMGKLKRKEGKIEHLTAAFYRRFIMSQFGFLTFIVGSSIIFSVSEKV